MFVTNFGIKPCSYCQGFQLRHHVTVEDLDPYEQDTNISNWHWAAATWQSRFTPFTRQQHFQWSDGSTSDIVYAPTKSRKLSSTKIQYNVSAALLASNLLRSSVIPCSTSLAFDLWAKQWFIVIKELCMSWIGTATINDECKVNSSSSISQDRPDACISNLDGMIWGNTRGFGEEETGSLRSTSYIHCFQGLWLHNTCSSFQYHGRDD